MSVTRFEGDQIAWPTAPDGARSTTTTPLTLLSAGMRAPRSGRLSAGILRHLTNSLGLHVRGVLRRTDFLQRRRNLNLPVLPLAEDEFGRDVYGSLTQDGSLITTGQDGNRRFPSFDDVWAIDGDGWSTYSGLTVGLEHRSRRVDLFGSLTRSRTEDNWLGAAAVHPDAQLSPSLPDTDGDWSEGISDFDVPIRASVGATIDLPVLAGVSLSGVYRYADGLPFTPGYRLGVDANGDGSFRNDVAHVPDAATLGDLGTSWPCLAEQSGAFAARNSCRGPARHGVDATLRLGIASPGGRRLAIVVDAFGLLERGGGVIDAALLLADPTGSIVTSPSGDTVTLPVMVNPDFGQVMTPGGHGRILRVGVTLGGGG